MLCDVLAFVYNVILGFFLCTGACILVQVTINRRLLIGCHLYENTGPEVLKMGIVIPILKKPTLYAGMPENYRLITLSSTHANMVEMLLGLIPDSVIRNTQFGFREIRGSSLGCALLNDVIAYFEEQGSPVYISTLDADKCFNSVWHDGLPHKLQSALPVNHWLLIYIYDIKLLEELKEFNSGLCIGDVKLESFACADDVSLFS